MSDYGVRLGMSLEMLVARGVAADTARHILSRFEEAVRADQREEDAALATRAGSSPLDRMLDFLEVRDGILADRPPESVDWAARATDRRSRTPRRGGPRRPPVRSATPMQPARRSDTQHDSTTDQGE